MRPEDEPEFAKALDAMASMFTRELDDPAILLYWGAVQSITIDQFKAAIVIAAASCRHFPPPVELLEFVAPAPSPMLQAAEAWPEVVRLAGRSNGDHSDPIAAKVIQLMGGGRVLGGTGTKELEVWGRKRFMELYSEVALREDQKELNAAPAPVLLSGGFEFDG